MQRRGRDEGTPDALVGDADLFFFFLKGGRLQEEAALVVESAEKGTIALRTSSEVYDDAISAIRAEGTSIEVANGFVSDMSSIRHTALPMSAEIAEKALSLYGKYGGRRRLSYFDAFHVATAVRYDLPLLTSDRFILQNAAPFGVAVRDLADWGR